MQGSPTTPKDVFEYVVFAKVLHKKEQKPWKMHAKYLPVDADFRQDIRQTYRSDQCNREGFDGFTRMYDEKEAV